MSRKGKVTVVGAGFYGSTTAQRLAEYDIFEEVVLTDIVEGKPEGLALDMNQSRPVERFETKVTGQTTGPGGEGYEVIGGSDIVIVTAGLARKPGMSRMDLIETNAKIVRSVVENVAKYAPDAVLIVVSNPLDEMTALAALLPADGIEQLVTRTRNGGGEIVALLKTGSAYYAPSAAAARMARAVAEDAGAVMPVCAWVDGQYGISGVYLGVEAELGATGIRRVVARDLTEPELAALSEAAEAVREKQAS